MENNPEKTAEAGREKLKEYLRVQIEAARLLGVDLSNSEEAGEWFTRNGDILREIYFNDPEIKAAEKGGTAEVGRLLAEKFRQQ